MSTTFGVLSLLPAALAIVLALWTRNVILSLFTAVFSAGLLLAHGDPFTGLAKTADPLLVGSFTDADHAKIVLFSLFVAGMVGIMGKAGGTRALVGAIARYGRSRRSVQLMSWLAGVVVFFDDYANCLIVGATMRPVCDRLKVSRSKLSYIVDSTAAPVATLALISTWVGFEVGVIQDGLEKAGVARDAYAFFLEGWGYRLYPILAIVMVGAVAFLGRDFRAMRRAEEEAGAGQALDAMPIGEEEAEPPASRLWLAILPVAVLLGVTLGWMVISGRQGLPAGAPLFQILGNADGLGLMMKGSLVALATAALLAIALRALSLKDTLAAAMGGMKELFEALAVLYLAWALGAAMKELHAAEFLVGTLRASLWPTLLPTVVFVVSAVTSFATGTSFGTMAILMPMVIPLAFSLAPHSDVIPLASSGSVLAGATFGDHCSPISDTTVLSAIGSGCDLVDHVRTQLPYALVTAGITVVFGTLPSGLGVPPWITIPVASAATVASLLLFGKRVAA